MVCCTGADASIGIFADDCVVDASTNGWLVVLVGNFHLSGKGFERAPNKFVAGFETTDGEACGIDSSLLRLPMDFSMGLTSFFSGVVAWLTSGTGSVFGAGRAHFPNIIESAFVEAVVFNTGDFLIASGRFVGSKSFGEGLGTRTS